MSKTLVVYMEVPDAVNFYLFPDDHNTIPVFEKANNFFVGTKIDHEFFNITVEDALEIEHSLNSIVTYMYEWHGGENYQGLNPDMQQYFVDNSKPINEVISKIITTGIIL